MDNLLSQPTEAQEEVEKIIRTTVEINFESKIMDLKNLLQEKENQIKLLYEELKAEKSKVLEEQRNLQDVSECVAEFALVNEILVLFINQFVDKNVLKAHCKPVIQNDLDKVLNHITHHRNYFNEIKQPTNETLLVKLGLSWSELTFLRDQMIFNCCKVPTKTEDTILESQSTTREKLEAGTFSATSECPQDKPKVEVVHEIKQSKTGHVCRCGMIFVSEYDFKRHLYRYTDEKKFSCTMCSNRFQYVDQLNKHLRSVHKVFSACLVGCYECGLTFSNRKRHAQHRKHAHNSVAQSDNVNSVRRNAVFPRIKKYRLFKSLNSTERPKIYKTRSFVREQQNKLQMPKLIRQSTSTHFPESGSKTTALLSKSKHSFREHGVNFTKSQHRQVYCICGLAFNGKYTLRRHIQIFSSMNKLSCSDCSRLFSSKRYFQVHKRIRH